MRPFLLPVAAAVTLAGCGQSKQLTADHAWVRLAAVPGRPAAGYFTLHGGQTDATLLRVASSAAIRAELHETMREGAAMAMRDIDRVAVPAREELTFAPGGKHVMLFDVNPKVTPGSAVPLRLTFADGTNLDVQAKAIAAGDAPPQF